MRSCNRPAGLLKVGRTLGSACREVVGKFVLEDFGGDLIFEKVRGGKGGQNRCSQCFWQRPFLGFRFFVHGVSRKVGRDENRTTENRKGWLASDGTQAGAGVLTSVRCGFARNGGGTSGEWVPCGTGLSGCLRLRP